MKKFLLAFLVISFFTPYTVVEGKTLIIRRGQTITAESTLSPEKQELYRKNREMVQRKKELEEFFMKIGYPADKAKSTAWDVSHMNKDDQKKFLEEENRRYEEQKTSRLEVHYPDVEKTTRAIDLVIVRKKKHQMELIKDNRVFKKYVIALGKSPVGHKQHRGDNKTPEGNYTLDYKKPTSTYSLSVHISYPNEQDLKNARRDNRDPGGMIMIHGQPNHIGYSKDTDDNGDVNVSKFVQPYNWTNGCIALLNADMAEFYNLVEPGTPIRILP